MGFLNILLLSILGFIALILIIPLFMRKVHHTQTWINIHVPAQTAFDYLKLVSNQEKFNKWANRGNRTEKTTGTDGTVGFIYSWDGDKDAGKGEKEIIKLVEGKRIEVEFRFEKPFKVTALFVTTTEAISATECKVSWSNTSALKYPLNIFVPMIERSLKKDMDESLNKLRSLLEK